MKYLLTILFLFTYFFLLPQTVFGNIACTSSPCTPPANACPGCSGLSTHCNYPIVINNQTHGHCAVTCSNCDNQCSCNGPDWGPWGSCDSFGNQARWCNCANLYQIQACSSYPTPYSSPYNTPYAYPYPTPPTCTVSLTPDPATIPDEATKDFTASVVPSNGTVDEVDFSISPPFIATISPSSDSSSPYRTTATGRREGTATIQARVIMGGSERCNDPANLTVTPPGPWWQVQDADVITLGDLISLIPPSLGEEFNLPGLGGFPGIGTYGGTTADFEAGSGAGTVSSTGWLANALTTSQKNYSYDYFDGLIPGSVVVTQVTSTSVDSAFLTSGPATNGYRWYRFDGSVNGLDLTINGTVNLGTNKVVLLVKGANLNIDGRINVTDGVGTFVTMVGKNANGNKGDILVAATAGTAAGVDLEGIYFADSEFKTGAGDTQLYVRGGVAAYDGVVLERDLDTANEDTPAEFFEYGLDQILLYPPSLSVRKIRWKEVAP